MMFEQMEQETTREEAPRNLTTDQVLMVKTELLAKENEILSDRLRALEDRVAKTAELVNSDSEKWVVWCDLNAESDALTRAIDGAIEVAGRHDDAHKLDAMTGFEEEEGE